MAESQFIPGSGSEFQTIGNGLQTGMSLMERAQAMRLRAAADQRATEMEDRQRAQYQALLPVALAKNQADIVTAKATVANHTQMEMLRAQGATASVDANNEFLQADSITDWYGKADALGKLQVKYAFLGNIRDDGGQPVYAGFLKAVDEARGNAVTRGKTDQDIAAHQKYGETLVSGRAADVAARGSNAVDVANIRADSLTAAAETRAASASKGHQSPFVQYVEEYNKAIKAGDQSTADFYNGMIAKSTYIAPEKKALIAELIQERDAATAAGRPQDAALISAQIEKQNTILVDPMKQVLANKLAAGMTATPAAAPVAPAPPPVAPPAPPAAAAAPVSPPVTPPVVPSAPAAPAVAKPYMIENGAVTFAHDLSPSQYLAAINQAVNDRVIDAETARAALLKMGFKPKKKP